MRVLLLIVFTSFFITQLTAGEIRIDTDIKSVKVYQQGAEISRDFSYNLPAGMTQVVLQNLSASVNPSSLQVKLSKSATLMSASFQFNYLGGTKYKEKVRALKDSIDILQFALQSTQAGIHALTEEESFIKSNKQIGGKDAALDLADLKAISTYARVRIGDIRVEILKEQKVEKKISKRLTKLNQQLNEWNSNRKQPSGEILLDVLTDVAQKVEFEVSYIVGQASWQASYDLRSDGVELPVTLAYKAEVRQNTGIDWDNVQLTISTGNPSISQERPVLRPWYIDFVQNYGSYKLESSGYSNKNLALDAVTITSADVQIERGGVQDQTVLQLNQLNEEFQIGLKYSIASDNDQHTVVMKDFTLDAKYQYHAVPKLDKDAFLLAKVTKWEKLSLLPGNANVFFENSYVGKSYINPLMTTDTMLISMGRDKRIVVNRDKVKDFTSEKLIGSNKTETISYKYMIRNTKNHSVSLEILDQIPISKNKDIEVKLIEKSGATYDSEYGKLEWNIILPPNSAKELSLIYSVKYPKKKRIPGI
ncbi:MAG: DUF4139 domain-containing protein [Chitinophagales bacterium]|nr:DUF4139 domain-containing protein [Chitinophagales bacterium]